MGDFMGYVTLRKMQDLVWRIDTSTDNSIDSARDNDYLIASHVDTDKEIELVIGKIDFRYHKNFIIFGMRNLNLISEIYKRKTPFSTMTIIEITEADTQSFCVDGDEKQLLFLEDPRVNLIIGCENELGRQLDVAFHDMLKAYNLRNTEVISMPYVKSMYPKELNNVLDTVFERLHTSVNAFGNDVEDILIGMDNYINNWKHVFRGLDCKYFENEYKGKPAIIVGAGPSLDKNIDFLSKAQGKALIFSVDGAMNTLMDKGIIPDVVSSIERVELTANFYKKKDIPEEVIYVGPNVVLGDILVKFKKIIFTGRSGDAFFHKLNDKIGFTNLNVGINVSNVLIAFARHLGCSPVIFMGLDLAYTDGKTHTKKFSDNFDEKFMNNYRNNIVYVKGQNGEMLESFEHFMHTKSWIESMIAADKAGVFINSTEGGANIEGAENLKLSDVISTYCIEEIPKLEAVYDKFKKDNIYEKETITNSALEFFNELKDYYENLNKEAESYYDKLFGSKKAGRVEFMEKQRMSMDEVLSNNLAGRFIVQSITIAYNRDIHSLPMMLEKEDEKKMYEINLKYYKTLKAVSKKIIESIEAYILILESHIDKADKVEV